MSDNKYPEINEVITYIHQNLDEPLSLERLARYASYSPYHFARIFKEKIGLSPHYYISSIRLQKAKDMLLNTNLSVRDVGMEVGQQSLGTFTTRFTQRVGISPAQFRHSPQQANRHLDVLQQMTNWGGRQDSLSHTPHSVHGTIQATTPFQGVILVGLFTKPIPEGMPLYGTLLSQTGDFGFYNVRSGTYYVMATAISWEMEVTDILLPHTTLRAKSEQAVIVKPDSITEHQRLSLREPHLDDPPILISLPILIQNYLNRFPLQGRI